ncbi:MAG: hypothetical protein NZM27_09730 [Acetobacteraceae bacterium]|nr:hypothetical protein [Acetobacteraceae bacterium]MCX7686321.1 hypothetical protein [Acetobacteraceae bacterium]MDW8398803.1 hypothetical protein [Acetobacteraceae bacterium]
MTAVALPEPSRILRSRLEDLLRFHGGAFPAGIVHGFQVPRRGLPLLAGGEPPDRRAIPVETGFPGPGARGAFEAATRCVTDGCFRCNPALGAGAAEPAASGQYWFRLGLDGVRLTLTVRPGLMNPEFLALSRKTARDAAEEARLLALRRTMAERLLAFPPQAAYDIA